MDGVNAAALHNLLWLYVNIVQCFARIEDVRVSWLIVKKLVSEKIMSYTQRQVFGTK